jgi:hypothetical protein
MCVCFLHVVFFLFFLSLVLSSIFPSLSLNLDLTFSLFLVVLTKVRRVEAEQELYEAAARSGIEDARNGFETATAAEMDRRSDLIEIRSRELQAKNMQTHKTWEKYNNEFIQDTR